ncbi:PilZ domain-containing protein [Pseudomonas sp. ok272]|uniref:PilZ domain-containing protein n=1 Tax=unclassified Pseudomonas TaxID=196821 RepID=UPI0008AD28AF|nr:MULTISPECIES: PilZ domain-containing protein [unclassified Pseudomonas]SEN00322.1 PilZ domain-containing protein [Pseudomonas sp. ok272]SFM88782.1 PilZ domain-containing protein [Pseudomonas sp. ok602]
MSQTDRDYSEKRDFIRMRVDANVTLIHAGDLIPAVCIDLSSSGMQVRAARSFQVGDQLKVRIESEHTALKGLEAETEVVWIKAQGTDSQKLGLTILRMS